MNTKVFISHQKRDRDEAKEIADYLLSMNIDVYFDEFDRELQQADLEDNPQAVVNAIKRGIRNSTHMLCVVSRNTLSSEWVPFEVGYGYDSTNLSTLTLKGISESELPDYIRTKPVIRDIYDINKFVKEQGKGSVLETKLFSAYDNSLHPLRNVMDSIR